MFHEPYVTYEYYRNARKGNVIPMDELDEALKQASRYIDSLTYNHIVGQKFSNPTALQQETIQEVVCRQVDFRYENTDEINITLQSYSVNGVSAQFSSNWSVSTDRGVTMKRDMYVLLFQTSLCCRLAR